MSTINVTNLSGRGGATPNLPDGANITGVATATSFDGSLKSTGTPTLGLGVTINASGVAISGVCTAGIVSATTFYGSGSGLTGVGESVAPWHYNPDVNDTLATVTTGIGITFNKKILAGSGTATLKVVNAGTAGTTIQSWGVSSATYNVTQFSLDSLVSPLTVRRTYQVDIPSTFIVDSVGTAYAGTAYTFTVQDAQGKMHAWGKNAVGLLGDGIGIDQRRSSPVQIFGSVENWSKGTSKNGNAINSWHNFAITNEGELWGWGDNGEGTLAQSNTVHYSSPVQVPGTTWGSVSRCYYATMAIKTDGTLWTWGNNSYGQLGASGAGPAKRSSPIQIPGTTWSKPCGGYYTNAAIKTDGTLWMWGTNGAGKLGQNNETQYSSPIQVPGTTWSELAMGHQNHSAATKTDGTLWTWGQNVHGCLGINIAASAYRSSPCQIPGTAWANVYGGTNVLYATRTDGTLWAWGRNQKGELGQNDRTDKSSPVQIPGTTWSSNSMYLSTGDKCCLAIKTDGTMWVWGDNSEGQLGDDSLVHRSSPVQVGSATDWIATSATIDSSFAIQLDQTP